MRIFSNSGRFEIKGDCETSDDPIAIIDSNDNTIVSVNFDKFIDLLEAMQDFKDYLGA